MGLETGTYLNDLVTTNPDGATDPKSQGDNHLRLIKEVLKNTFPGLAGSAFRLQTKSANYTIIATDNMSVIVCTSELTLALTSAATLGNKHMIVVICRSNSVTLDPAGIDTVNSSASATLSFNEAAMLFCDGTSDFVMMKLGGIGGTASTGDVKSSFKTTAEPGWIFATGSIGDASSSATTRANADCEALFKLLYNMADAEAPVSGGRGASAAADWAAHKHITIPNLEGCVIAGKANMSGSDRGNLANGTTLGKSIGDDTHTLVAAEQADMSVTGTFSGTTTVAAASFAASGPTVAADGNINPIFYDRLLPVSGTITGTADGGGGAHNNVQPTVIMNIFIKL